MIKNRSTYKSIGEVAKELSINTHTIRFWEKEFKQIKPITLNAKRRYYSEKDIDILKIVFELLKKQGYTISGAKKVLNNSTLQLDDETDLSVKRRNFKSSLKLKAQRVKLILDKIKKFKND